MSMIQQILSARASIRRRGDDPTMVEIEVDALDILRAEVRESQRLFSAGFKYGGTMKIAGMDIVEVDDGAIGAPGFRLTAENRTGPEREK